MTMREHKGSLEDLKVAIIGDITHSRVVRSNLWGLSKLGAEVRVAGPATMMPIGLENTPAIVCHRVEDAVQDCDVVMGLRVQLERQNKALFPTVNEYAHFFGLSDRVLALAKPDAIVMHPGPANRGLDIMSSVHDHERSVIEEQVTNGVAIRMAVLFLLNAARNKAQSSVFQI